MTSLLRKNHLKHHHQQRQPEVLVKSNQIANLQTIQIISFVLHYYKNLL